MAEPFELVRTTRQHIRRGAAFLEQGRFDDALREIESALTLDPDNASAQAVRDRINSARILAAHGGPSRTTVPDGPAPSSKGFVPYGVNAASWRGFEQRITERRFRALIDTANSAIVAGDPVGARAALEEARDLKPDAPELGPLEARLAAMPPVPPVRTAVPASRVWMRAMGAAAMFLVGVSMLIGLEWLRPIDTISSRATVVGTAPLPSTEREFRVVGAPDASGVGTGGVLEDESVPAVVTPPEPLLQPRGTGGTVMPPTETRPVAERAPLPVPPPSPTAVVDIPARATNIVEQPPIRPIETPDDVVARASAGSAAIDPAVLPSPAPPDALRTPAPSPRAPERDTVVAAENRPEPSAPEAVPAASTAAAAATSARAEQTRVEQVLRRYAQAYGELNASAARAVWPTVDEKALARAFQNLSSQDVSFDACDIRIRGEVADASCRGQQQYTVKVGSREPRVEPRTWHFELRRAGDGWMIEGVNARRLQAAAAYREQ